MLQSDSPVPSRLSQKAASVWQHYETAQACERDLATEQQITPIPKQGSDINTDGLNSQPPVLVEDCAPKQEPEGKNEEKGIHKNCVHAHVVHAHVIHVYTCLWFSVYSEK